MTEIITLLFIKLWAVIYVYLCDEMIRKCWKYGGEEENIQNFRSKT